MLKKYAITHIYLTHKTVQINPIDITTKLKAEIHSLDIIPTISAKYYASIEEIEELITQAKAKNIPDLLIVSGAKRGIVDSIQIMNKIHTSNMNFYCVFNPYLPPKKLETEKLRLRQKLQNKNIKGIFLQIGTDVNKLKEGIEYSKSLNSTIQIATSLLFPTQEFLEKMKLQPWGDIHFEEKYINDLTYAKERTRAVYSYAIHNNLPVLVQLLPLNKKNIEEFLGWQKNIQKSIFINN